MYHVFMKGGHWNEIENRRRFLLEFAERVGFDPMVKANWIGKTPLLQANKVFCIFHYFLFNKKKIQKKGSGILTRYGGSIKAMLSDTFPEMFKKTKGCSFLPPPNTCLLFFTFFIQSLPAIGMILRTGDSF